MPGINPVLDAIPTGAPGRLALQSSELLQLATQRRNAVAAFLRGNGLPATHLVAPDGRGGFFDQGADDEGIPTTSAEFLGTYPDQLGAIWLLEPEPDVQALIEQRSAPSVPSEPNVANHKPSKRDFLRSFEWGQGVAWHGDSAYIKVDDQRRARVQPMSLLIPEQIDAVGVTLLSVTTGAISTEVFAFEDHLHGGPGVCFGVRTPHGWDWDEDSRPESTQPLCQAIEDFVRFMS
jgi:hypothetical protein